MKKLIKNILSVSALIFLFAACGNNDDDSSSEAPAEPKVIPTFSPIGGFYKEKQSVSISCDDTEKIYYTITKKTYDDNGKWNETAWQEAVKNSKPTENSSLYEKTFEIDDDCIIRAMAVKKDGTKRYAMTCFDFDLENNTDFSGTNLDSPDWQNQVIYFLVTDRFANGNSENDKLNGLTDQKGNAYDESKILPGQPVSGYNGGDLAGITQKLDYIKELGCTAIWITPPIKNQVAEGNYHGYHGYWASDFTQVDEHFGTLKDYQTLVDEAHKRGIAVIQDIVVNHTGDYQKISDNVQFTKEKIVSGDTKDFKLNSDSVPLNHPEQLPWAFNNIVDLTEDEFESCSFYHFNSTITDFTNPAQRYTWQSSNLDDIATDNPVVRNLLRGYFRYWIDKAGIDGYRIDTVMYVEEDFFEDFINSTESGNLGIRPYAATKGKKDFINFGEAWSSDEKLVSGYTRSEKGKKRIDGMIYFPLRFAITDTISGGSRTDAISKVLLNRYKQDSNVYYQNPDRLVTWIDNHDTERFGKIMYGTPELVKAAYGIIFTIPGIPQLYYGVEQGFDGDDRAGMFAGSYKSAGQVQTKDYFDTDGEWFKYFQNLIAMRRENSVFRSNRLEILADTSSGAGLFAYVIQQTDSEGKAVDGSAKNKAIYIMNTSGVAQVLSNTCSLLAAGEEYKIISEVSACPSASELASVINIGKNKEAEAIIPGHSCAIYLLEKTNSSVADSSGVVKITSLPENTVSGNSLEIKGKATKAGLVKAVIDGDYSAAVETNVNANEEFSINLKTDSFNTGKIEVQLLLISEGGYYYSEKGSFDFSRPYVFVKRIKDGVLDDNGVGIARGKVALPTDTSFIHQMDIMGVDVYRAGNNIRLGVMMNTLSNTWNPTSNYFDHVIFHLFISDGDDNTGCEYHPNYDYKLPENFGKWDYMYQCNGWGQAFYSCDGAGKDSLGKAVTPTPSNSPVVDWKNITNTEGLAKLKSTWNKYLKKEIAAGTEWQDVPGMIWFTIPANAIGNPANLSGYKFYINTYDFDMGNPRGMIVGKPEQYKYATSLSFEETGSSLNKESLSEDEINKIILDKTPKVIDELDASIILE